MRICEKNGLDCLQPLGYWFPFASLRPGSMTELLIIKPSSLGDIVHGLQVATSLKAQRVGSAHLVDRARNLRPAGPGVRGRGPGVRFRARRRDQGLPQAACASVRQDEVRLRLRFPGPAAHRADDLAGPRPAQGRPAATPARAPGFSTTRRCRCPRRAGAATPSRSCCNSARSSAPSPSPARGAALPGGREPESQVCRRPGRGAGRSSCFPTAAGRKSAGTASSS